MIIFISFLFSFLVFIFILAFRNQNEINYSGNKAAVDTSLDSVVSNAITANFNGDHYVRSTDTTFSGGCLSQS